ncbi:MAG: hypothetical protein COW30_16305 [Rhodospirillales bacterium CG15_BIG_FIL_POST_REV_8_21_14_020_66_15]|nr:MAG: hypothetical protein COW30_16305 [Rhodospirillales bacterium CG15_BIG_FIL_POST_REV_8_21_14_020_66_15]
MSEISAPPPPPPVTPGAGTPLPPPTAITLPPAQAQIPVPQAILDAALGARFDLQVVSLTPQGLVTLEGVPGKLQLQLQALLNLNPGDTVTLQLNGRGPQLQFIIASINGQSPAAALRAAALAVQGGAQTAPGAGVLNLPPFAQGNSLIATLLRPAPGISAPVLSGAPLAAPGPAPASGQASPLLQGALSPATGPSASQPATPGPTGAGGAAVSPKGGPAGRTPAGPGAPAPTGGVPGVSTRVLPAGTQFTVQVAVVQPSPSGGPATVTQTQGPSPALAALGQTLTGIVSGAQAGNQPIVDTPLGPIAIAGANPPPEGSRVVLNITSAPLPPAAPEPLLDSQQLTLRQALFLDRQWPAMREVIETLAHAAPNAAQHVLHTALPRPDGNLTSNILFFLAAVRGADLRAWLGDSTVRVLQRVNPSLLGRVRNDLGQLARLTDEPGSGDWRIFMIPFLNGSQLEQIRLFTRPQHEDEEDAEGDAGTRFVVDITLSKLGHIQLDGLVDPPHRRMDMVVRSDTHLPPDMRNDIRHLYEQSGEITGYRGGVGFQAQPANFIEIEPPAPAKGGVGLIV